MRAAVLRDRKLVVDTIPDPEPGPGQVLAKTLACGICGSDLHVLEHPERMVEASQRGAATSGMDLDRDIVMGHEFCAEIVDHGPQTGKALPKGTRVTSMPVLLGPDGIHPIGYSNEAPGGYGEYLVLNEALLLEVPDALPTDHVALTEPMAVGLHAVEKAKLTPEDVPLVIGCGPVGLAVVAALRLQGAGPIVAADFSARRRDLARDLGADVVLDPGETSPYASWREAAAPSAAGGGAPLAASIPGLGPPLRPGVFFECVGLPGVIRAMMGEAPRGARVIVVGVCMEEDRIEPMIGIEKELALQFVLGYTPVEFAATLRHLVEGKIQVGPLITGKVGVQGVPGAFRELASPERHAKILVEPWRD